MQFSYNKTIFYSFLNKWQNICVPFWSHHFKENITEKFPKRATQMIKGLKHPPDETWLKSLGLFNLEKMATKGK